MINLDSLSTKEIIKFVNAVGALKIRRLFLTSQSLLDVFLDHDASIAIIEAA